MLSYGELDKRANQLAHRLVALGVGPEVPVGVMIPRSLHLVVALLGVLKAGGAYVPMDPDYPPDRLALMMEDSEVGMCASAACSTAAIRKKKSCGTLAALLRPQATSAWSFSPRSLIAALLPHFATSMTGGFRGCRRRCC